MDGGTRTFWALVVGLALASLFFGAGAEQRRRAVVVAEASLATGDIVQLQQVVDGDSIIAAKDGQPIPIRLLGIKAFAAAEKGAGARYGQEARVRLASKLEGKPLRVMLHDPPRDKHGRYLAELFVDEADVGLELVQEGLALVYTVYPFPSMSVYLREQAAARSRKAGLWADEGAAERARLLVQEWGRQSE